MLRDVPRRGAATEDLRRLLTCDHMTGAANRMHFQKCLDRVREGSESTGRAAALVMVDLDHFKRVNDHYGHGHHSLGTLIAQGHYRCTNGVS